MVKTNRSTLNTV